MNFDDIRYSFKIVLIGDAGVGKSAIFQKYSDPRFDIDTLQSTIGVDFKVVTRQVNGERVKLMLWDTAGQERFRSITRSYYKSANGMFVVFDLTRRQTFDNLSMWFGEAALYGSKEVPFILIGNKFDLVRECAVSREEIVEFCNLYNCPYFETSAKTAHNLERIFDEMTRRIYDQYDEMDFKQIKPKLSPILESQAVADVVDNSSSGSCCS